MHSIRGRFDDGIAVVLRALRHLPFPKFDIAMCRNIKTLFNFDPPATDREIRDASLQFVRKLSGFNAPSRANAEAFDRAIDEVAASARKLIDALVTTAGPRDRGVEATKARLRSAQRFVART
jgi:hypothetical protein